MQRGLLLTTIGVACVLSACLGGDGGGKSASGKRASSNRPPTITGTPSPSIATGEIYEFRPTVADPEGDELAFTVQRIPAWATFDRTTGRLAGTPDAADIGPYTNIRISVSDGHASVALPNFDIVVSQVGEGAVTLSWLPPTENADGSVLTDLAGYRIYYGRSVNLLNQSIVLNNPGLTRHIVEQLPRGKWIFAMTAVSARGRESARSSAVSKVVG